MILASLHRVRDRAERVGVDGRSDSDEERAGILGGNPAVAVELAPRHASCSFATLPATP